MIDAPFINGANIVEVKIASVKVARVTILVHFGNLNKLFRKFLNET